MARKVVSRRRRKAGTKKKQKTVRRTKYAVIPECQERLFADKEYTTNREEKLWDPNVDAEEMVDHYCLAARVVLTYKQQHGSMPNIEAIKNSCSGVSQQYILDVLHESKYEPHEALKTIFQKDMPQKVIDKWKPEEMQLFTEGIMKHGKRFQFIRRELLPHKRVEDFADFYYVWKRSSMAEAWRQSRAIIKAEEKEMEEKRSMERTNKSPCNLLNNELFRNLSKNKIMTRSATAAAIRSLQNSKENGNDSKSSTSSSPSETNGETSGTAESTDSPMKHVQKLEDELPETATSEKSPMKNEQILDNSMKQTHNIEEKSVDETEKVECVLAPTIPQWKRQRTSEHIV